MHSNDKLEVRLILDGFRVTRKGEPGYHQRLYLNEETGEVITRYKFRKLATPIAYIRPLQQPETKKPKKTPVSKKPAKKTEKIIRQPTPSKSVGTITNVEPSNFMLAKHKAQKLHEYNKALDAYVKTVNKHLKEIGGFEPITRNIARQDENFKQYYRDYKNVKDREKGGKRHLALIYFGYLEEDDDYY